MKTQTRSRIARYGIELLVVFVGVWLGLIAENYREARAEVAAERISLGRLLRDLEQNERDLTGNLERARAGHAAARWLIEQADAGYADLDSLSHYLQLLQLRSVLAINASEYTALKSAGRINIIRDADLRQLVTELYELFPVITLAHERENDELRRAMEQIGPYVLTGLPNESGFPTVVATGSPEQILRHRTFRIAVSDLAYLRTFLEDAYVGQLRRIEQIRAAVLDVL